MADYGRRIPEGSRARKSPHLKQSGRIGLTPALVLWPSCEQVVQLLTCEDDHTHLCTRSTHIHSLAPKDKINIGTIVNIHETSLSSPIQGKKIMQTYSRHLLAIVISEQLLFTRYFIFVFDLHNNSVCQK